jgi:thiol-disulfide isomerase/thioredoxin
MHRLPVSALAILVLASACSAAGGGAGESPDAGSAIAASPAAASPRAATATARPVAPLTGDPLYAVQLTDVRTGETFTLGALAAERPVLLEAMAIWCTNCLQQQQYVRDAHGGGDFTSISLDVDPTERPADLAQYAKRQIFDWRFAVADASLAQALRARFGTAVLDPPTTPKIVLLPDGTIRALDFSKILTPTQLLAALGLQ